MSLAQQPNGWSPQPFVKPNTQAIDLHPVSVPHNSLRQREGQQNGESQQNGEVLRWKSANGPLRAESLSKSFSRALTPAESQPQTESPRSVTTASRSPSPDRSVALSTQLNQSTQLIELTEPRSGFELLPQRKQNINSQVQLTSYNEVSNESAVTPEPRASGVWYDRSSAKDVRPTPASIGSATKNSDSRRTDIQRAKYQEPLSLPPALDRIPVEPNGGLPGNRLDLDSTRALNEVLEPAPFRSQLPPIKSSLPLVEPEQIPASPFPGPKSLSQEKVDRSPSDFDEPPQIGSMRDPAPKPPLDQRIDRSVMDCDAMRSFLISQSDITTIRVDSSPSFVEGYKNPKSATANTKEGFVSSAKSRSWLSYEGQVVA